MIELNDPYRLSSALLGFLILALLVISATSCQIIEDVIPKTTARPVDAPPTITSADESPRLRNPQELPPTWTPSVQESSATPVAPSQVSPETGAQASYVVQAGDTLAEIALRFNVSLDELARANDLEDIDHIEVGQVLVIP